MKKIKLFCFPYAGASAAVYSSWKEYIQDEIQLVPVELAGRGKKIHEPLYETVDNAVTEILERLKGDLSDQPYAFFGHSMGAMLAHELVDRIKLLGLPTPVHVFFSGRSAPSVRPGADKKYHLLNETDFKEKVLSLGGTPPHFFEHPELMNLFLPVLRNDFRLCSNDFSERHRVPIDSPITVFIGKEEDITAEGVDAWKNHTSLWCRIYYFRGGHFFINDFTEEIVRIINETLIFK